MRIFKAIFGGRGSRLWFIVTAAVTVLLLVVTLLATTVFFEILNVVMPGGGGRARYAEGVEAIYVSDYASKKQTLAAANALNIDLCREGIVLLKNNGALPVQTPESGGTVSVKPKISVFGKNSVDLAYGGSGSGGGSAADGKTLYDSLSAAGFDVNPSLKAFYENTAESGAKRKSNSSDLDSGDTVVLSTAETPQASYTQKVKSSYAAYNEAAIVVFTRIGGEGFDLPRSMAGAVGARQASDHYLQLDKNEAELLAAVCAASFKAVIVVINSGAAMELSFLEDSGYYAYQSKIDAALWMGFPGGSGVMALGEILCGKVNPSGRLVDTYAADFKKDPVWNNFGDNFITGNSGNRTLGGDQYALDGNPQLYYFVDYEEGVYVGYKYYETRGYTDGEAWYDEHVVYPFGYGLSYTTFSWEVADASSIESKAISADGTYPVKVKVTNTGTVAGKEVVQLYASAPYTAGKIEKPYKVLGDFAKTELLQPNQSETVTLTFDPYYLASYDFKDANGNGFFGYELDAGSYKLFVGKNAHESVAEIPFSVSAGIRYGSDPTTDYAVENRYTDQSNAYFNSDTQLSVVLSRADWAATWPTAPTTAERNATAAFINALKDVSPNNPNDYGGEEMPYFDEPVSITLRDMLVEAYGGTPFADYDDERWSELLDQCSVKELTALYDNGAFKTKELTGIGKPLTNDTDGPAGFVNFMDNSGTYYGTCYYCAETVIASTWNAALVQKLGETVGNEGIWGADGKGNGMPYSGWYAPGVNLHRSPFGGRNFEYFSEDGILSGKLAAAEIRGCQSKGVYCFVKHFALNEQETHRSIGGDCTWVTEQAMREIFLRPFEIAVKEGGTRAVMTSFNRIGTRWTGGDYRLLTEILRNEWGFRGTVLCDFNTVSYMDSRQMAYAGGDLNLTLLPKTWVDGSSVEDVIVLRQSAKNILYTVVNSNAMNGEVIGYTLPIWLVLLIVLDCTAVLGFAVWGFFAIRAALRKKEPPTAVSEA